MGKLIKNEMIKLFNRKSSWMMFIVLVVAMFAMSFMMLKINESMTSYSFDGDEDYEYNGGMMGLKSPDGEIISEDEFWAMDPEENTNIENYESISLTVDETVENLEKKIASYEKNPEQNDPYAVKSAKKQLEYYQAYQKEGTMPPDPREGQSSANFFSSFGSIYALPTIFAVIIASMMLAAEFTSGTIKLLLIRPYSRWQIITSKYIVTLLYSLMLSVIMAGSAFVFSFMLPSQSLTVPLSADLGSKTALVVASQLFGTNLLLMVLYVTIAFFFSGVVRSQSLAVGIGMGVLFSGTLLGQFLPTVIAKYDWLKWIIFNLLNLNEQVLDSAYSVGGNLSVPTTIFGIIVYIVLIYGLTVFLFNKRDVALS